MKLIINLGNKTIKDKNLLNKLAEYLGPLSDLPPEKKYPENIIYNNKGIREKLTENKPANPSPEIIKPEYIPDINLADKSFLSLYMAEADNIIKQTNTNSYPGNYAQTKNENTNNMSGNISLSRMNRAGETGTEKSNEENSFDKIINNMNLKVLSFTESAGNSFKKMWDDLVSKGRKAKDPWDAVWVSLRDSAMKRIGEILKTELFNDLFTRIAGGGSSKGFLGSIISGIAGFFTGGVLSKTGTEMFPANTNVSVNSLTNSSYNTNRELVTTFNRYAEAAEKWQRELKVVNDLFENNRGIKTVQEYLNKIKS